MTAKAQKLEYQEEKKETGKVFTFRLSQNTLPETNELTPARAYYVPHFILLAKSFSYQGTQKNILSGTDELYQWYASLIKQLKPGGRMVVPVGSRFMMQELMSVDKTDDDKIESRQVLPVVFVPVTGGH